MTLSDLSPRHQGRDIIQRQITKKNKQAFIEVVAKMAK